VKKQALKKSRPNTKRNPLEKLHSQLFVRGHVLPADSSNSLEQPDFLMIVPSITTYDSKYQIPLPIPQ